MRNPSELTAGFEHQESPIVERLFYPDCFGYVFATNHLVQRLQLPFYGLIAISLDDKPLHVVADNQDVKGQAIAAWARDLRFQCDGVRFVVVAINPFHTMFRSFTKIPGPGAIALDAQRFAPYADLMKDALLSPNFDRQEALTLHSGVLAAAVDVLPRAPELDSRAQTLMSLLTTHPRSTLSDLANALKLSYHRTSHLFTQAVGVPVRTYMLWQKLYRAGEPLMRGASLTEAAHAAGFVDSSHFSKAFQTAYGRSPREMFKKRRIYVTYEDPFSDVAIERHIKSGHYENRVA